MKNITEWINEMLVKPIKPFESSFSKDFGFVTMSDGRKAQIKVDLELDEECWD